MKVTCTRCGTIDEPVIEQNGPHKSAYCKHCNKWITHIRQQPDDDFELFFGMYKGRTVKSMVADPKERSYLVWLYDNAKSLKGTQRKILEGLLHL